MGRVVSWYSMMLPTWNYRGARASRQPESGSVKCGRCARSAKWSLREEMSGVAEAANAVQRTRRKFAFRHAGYVAQAAIHL